MPRTGFQEISAYMVVKQKTVMRLAPELDGRKGQTSPSDHSQQQHGIAPPADDHFKGITSLPYT